MTHIFSRFSNIDTYYVLHKIFLHSRGTFLFLIRHPGFLITSCHPTLFIYFQFCLSRVIHYHDTLSLIFSFSSNISPPCSVFTLYVFTMNSLFLPLNLIPVRIITSTHTSSYTHTSTALFPQTITSYANIFIFFSPFLLATYSIISCSTNLNNSGYNALSRSSFSHSHTTLSVLIPFFDFGHHVSLSSFFLSAFHIFPVHTVRPFP